MDKILLVIGSYLVGSIPFGVMIAHAHGVRILDVGSGNPGATNVWRTCGKLAGLSVLILDVAKGWLPAFVGGLVTHSSIWAFGCGLVAILGHSFSPFLKFRGGKGISTGLGALIGGVPAIAGGSFAAFLVVLVLTRFVSLASLVAATVMVVLGFVLREPIPICVALLAMSIFLFWRHRDNIVRIANGTERKFSFSSKSKSDAGEEKRSEQTAEEEEN